MRVPVAVAASSLIVAAAMLIAASDPPQALTGSAAYGDWKQDAPGTRRQITAADLPPPFATGSTRETEIGRAHV